MMKKSLKKSLAGVALVAAIGLGSAGSASADAVAAQFTVPAGGRSCVVTRNPALYRMRAEGSIQAGFPSQAQWTVHQSYDGVNYQTLPLTASGLNYTASLDRAITPLYFPGSFKLCLRNVSTTLSLKGTLTLLTDASAY